MKTKTISIPQPCQCEAYPFCEHGKPTKWERVQWPYNSEKPYSEWECWKATIGRTTVIIHPGQWPQEGLSFVVVGEYSGFLPGLTTFEQAKAELEKRFASK